MIIDAVDLMDAINWFTRFDRVIINHNEFICQGVRYKVEPHSINGQLPDKFDQYKIVTL